MRAVRGAGGWTELLGGVRVAGLEPQVALPGGLTASADDLGLLMKGDGEPNAWPRNKRKGAQKPKYTTDLAADEGKNGAHTGARHVEVTTRDLRAACAATLNWTPPPGTSTTPRPRSTPRR